MERMGNYRIEPGDEVRVCFLMGGEICGKVSYKPSQVGDVWIIVGANRDIHYVQSFSCITKESEKLQIVDDDDVPF